MVKYAEKLKRRIFIFLGAVLLIINLMTYHIVTRSMDNKFMEMAQSHIELLYENCQRKMSVLEQQFLSWTNSAQFIETIKQKERAQVAKKLKNYYQSTPGVNAVAVYDSKEGGMEYLTGLGTLNNTDKDLGEIIGNQNLENIESCWYISQQNKRINLAYFCPITEEVQIGYMIVEIELDYLLPELKDQSYGFWEEHQALVNGELIWSDDSEYWDEADILRMNEQNEYRVDKQTFVTSKAITQTGVNLVQVITLKMDKQYKTLALSLAGLYIISLLLVYFCVNKLTGSIMKALINLKKKMEQIQ